MDCERTQSEKDLRTSRTTSLKSASNKEKATPQVIMICLLTLQCDGRPTYITDRLFLRPAKYTRQFSMNCSKREYQIQSTVYSAPHLAGMM